MKIERPSPEQPMPQEAKRVFKGVVFDVYQWQQKMFDGSTATFEKLKRPDTVVVFPVLPDGRIILTEQEQPGKDFFIGAAGGRVEEGEDVLEGAKRELLEETGCEAEKFILWDAQQITTKIDYVVYTFIAKGVKKVSEINLDPGEKIKLKLVTFNELLDIAMDKKFAEKEVVVKFLEAKFDPQKKEELLKLFNPSI